MKEKLNTIKLCFVLLALIISFAFSIPAKAFLELNKELTFTIAEPGLFPFSPTSNPKVVEQTQAGNSIDFTFTNLVGGAFTVTPIADGREFGDATTITPNPDKVTTVIVNVNFIAAPPGSTTFGLYIVPLTLSSRFTVLAEVSQFILPTIPVGDGPTSEDASDEITTPSIPGAIPADGEDEDIITSAIQFPIVNPNGVLVQSIVIDRKNFERIINELSKIGGCEPALLPGAISTNITIGQSESTVKCEIEFLLKNKIAPGCTINSNSANLISKTINKATSLSKNSKFTLFRSGDSQKSTKTVKHILNNRFNEPAINITTIYPGFEGSTHKKKGRKRAASNKTSVTIQHSLITKTVQLTPNRGITSKTKDKEDICITPVCGFGANKDDIQIGSCLATNANKREAQFAETLLSYVPFIANEENRLSGRPIFIDRDNPFFILQVVPAKTMLLQTINLTDNIELPRSPSPQENKFPCPNPVECEKSCSNLGRCCESDENGFQIKECDVDMENFLSTLDPLQHIVTCICRDKVIERFTPLSPERQTPCPKPVRCESFCRNKSECCEADKEGFQIKACKEIATKHCTCAVDQGPGEGFLTYLQCPNPDQCFPLCSENDPSIGKCCEKDSNGFASRICIFGRDEQCFCKLPDDLPSGPIPFPEEPLSPSTPEEPDSGTKESRPCPNPVPCHPVCVSDNIGKCCKADENGNEVGRCQTVITGETSFEKRITCQCSSI